MSSCGQQIVIKRPAHQHLHTDIPDFDSSVTNIINSTILNSASANWNSVYSTVEDLSAAWNAGGGTDLLLVSQSSACWNAACSGNTVFQNNSSDYNSVYSTVHSNSATWDSVTTFNSKFVHLSGDIMIGGLSSPSLSTNTLYVGASTIYFINSDGQVVNYLNSQDVLNFRNNFTSTTGNSGNWESVYSTVNDLSAQWIIDLDNSEVNNFVFSNSATILDVNTVIQDNSATTWNYQGNDVKALSSNWQNTFTDFSTQSANNASVYSNVLATSASWSGKMSGPTSSTADAIARFNGTSGTVIKNTSAVTIDDTGIITAPTYKTTPQVITGKYISVNNSGITFGTSTNAGAIALPIAGLSQNLIWYLPTDSGGTLALSSDYRFGAYNTVNSNSATTWNYQGNDVKALTANYEDISTVVQANSAQWAAGTSVEADPVFTTWASANSGNYQSVYTTVQNHSAIWGLSGGSSVDTSQFYRITGGLLDGNLLTNTIISANSANFNVVKFTNLSNPSWEEGRVFYDNTEHTLAYYNDNSGMTVNIGQEQIVRVYNGTGSDIINGQVVYLDGSHGNTPQVFLANAVYTNDNCDKILGIATTDIPSTGNKIGYVTTMGIVHEIDVGTDVYTEGDNIFLDVIDGKFSKTSPEKPNHIVDLGIVTGTRGGGSNNIIDVIVRVNEKGRLLDLHDVITSSLSSNDILLYNPTSGGYWYNSTSNNWQNTYLIVNSNSAQWAIDTDNSDVNNFVFSNSATLLSVESVVQTNSSIWASTTNTLYDSVYATVNSNSATIWNYQGNDVKALSSNWESGYSTVNANSSTWNSGGGGDAEVNTFVYNNSATILDVDTVIQSNSAIWNAGGFIDGYGSIYSNYNALAGDKLAIYTTLSAIAITLPVSPLSGDSVWLLDAQGQWQSNNVIIQSDQNIQNVEPPLYCDVNWSDIQLTYVGGSEGWRIYPRNISDVTPVASTTSVGNNLLKASFGIGVNGNGYPVLSGSKGYTTIPYDCTINSWTVITNTSSEYISFDIKKSSYSSFPTNTSIVGTDYPYLSAVYKNTSSNLSSWSANVSAGDILEYQVRESTLTQAAYITLFATKTNG